MNAVLRSIIELSPAERHAGKDNPVRHAIRHVLTPVITMLGMEIGYFLGRGAHHRIFSVAGGSVELAYNAMGTSTSR